MGAARGKGFFSITYLWRVAYKFTLHISQYCTWVQPPIILHRLMGPRAVGSVAPARIQVPLDRDHRTACELRLLVGNVNASLQLGKDRTLLILCVRNYTTLDGTFHAHYHVAYKNNRYIFRGPGTVGLNISKVV